MSVRRANVALWVAIGIPIFGAALSLTMLVISLSSPLESIEAQHRPLSKTSWEQER